MHSLFWIFDNVISADKCKEYIDLANDNFHKAGIGGDELLNTGSIDEDTRKTNIFWSDNKELFELATKYGKIANKEAGWNLDVKAIESFQIGQYPVGGHYDWHPDSSGMFVNDHNLARKISMVLWLNEDFEGGEFEFHKCYTSENIIKPSIGTMVFFPSWMIHRVKPVTKGVRYSAVSWILGKPLI